MFQVILKFLLMGVLIVGAFVVLAHVFPVVVVVLAIAGIIKLYEIFRGPRRPPPGPWR